MKKKIFNVIASTDSYKSRIDKFLQSQLSELSRTRIQNFIREGHVKLNDNIIYETSKKIRNKDITYKKFSHRARTV